MTRGIRISLICLLLVLSILVFSVSVITGGSGDEKGICKGTPAVSCDFDYNSCVEQSGCRWEGTPQDGECIVLPCIYFEHDKSDCLVQGCSWNEFSDEECVLFWASWEAQTGRRINIEKTLEGDEVPLYVYGSESCEEKTISFEVFEDDFGFDDSVTKNPLNIEFNEGVAIGKWTAEYQKDIIGRPEYYFVATIAGNSNEKISSFHGYLTLFDTGDELIVKECDEDCRALGSMCAGNPSCEEFNNDKIKCLNQDGCKWIREGEGCSLVAAHWNTTIAQEGDLVELIVEGIYCDGKEIELKVWGDDTRDYRNQAKVDLNPLNVVFNGDIARGNWIVEYQEYEKSSELRLFPEYYFIATVVDNPHELIRGGMGSETDLKVAKCGDKICNIYENHATCPLDCEEGEEGGGRFYDHCKGSPVGCSEYNPSNSYFTGDACENAGCNWDEDNKDCSGFPDSCNVNNNDKERCIAQWGCGWMEYEERFL